MTKVTSSLTASIEESGKKRHGKVANFKQEHEAESHSKHLIELLSVTVRINWIIVRVAKTLVPEKNSSVYFLYLFFILHAEKYQQAPLLIAIN